MLGLFFGSTKDEEEEADSKELNANGQLIINPDDEDFGDEDEE